MVMSLATAASWLRSASVIVSYADIFYRNELVRGLAGTPGQLVISYDHAWRRLWTRRFTDPWPMPKPFGSIPRGTIVGDRRQNKAD
jgi:hypothetical protein